MDLLLYFESRKFRVVFADSIDFSKTVFMKNGFAPKDYIKGDT